MPLTCCSQSRWHGRKVRSRTPRSLRRPAPVEGQSAQRYLNHEQAKSISNGGDQGWPMCQIKCQWVAGRGGSDGLIDGHGTRYYSMHSVYFSSSDCTPALAFALSTQLPPIWMMLLHGPLGCKGGLPTPRMIHEPFPSPYRAGSTVTLASPDLTLSRIRFSAWIQLPFPSPR